MGKRHLSHNKRIELLDAYAESGLNVKEYAAANCIGYSTLQRWLSDRKTDSNTTDSAHSLNPADTQISEQLPATKQGYQSSASSEPPVHFMDITSRIIHRVSPEEGEEREHTQANGDLAPTAPISAPITTKKSVKTTSLELCNQIDVLLPNGIRVTFHQTSLDMSVALIKSLV